MLWLALHFPLLSLEALSCRCTSEESPVGEPAAVIARGRILGANRTAAAAGVTPGMGLSSALGLVPGLAVFERDDSREKSVFHELACQAGKFTPQLSLEAPGTLLLEIGGCLRLFGGLAALHKMARNRFSSQGFTVRSAVAPTPLGALWLAKGRDRSVCADLSALNRVLADLPWDLPDWGAVVQGRLKTFGLKNLGEVMALPRAELARRIGQEVLLQLARARGEEPDLRPWFAFPEKFFQTLELPAKVEAASMLVFAGQRLLASLGGWLAARSAAVTVCRLVLEQDGGGRMEVLLRPAEATRDEARLLRLLRERLDVIQLAAPVLAISLSAEQIVHQPGSSGSLFAGERVEMANALSSLERLRARLGDDCVFTLTARPDYRPEAASGRTQPEAAAPTAPLRPGARPLWLLPVPRLLPEVAGRPHWGGDLNLLAGPERLESGWWDEGEEQEGGRALGDLRRDYFVAGNEVGQRLWIFRNAEGWFLHGVFA